MHSFSYEIPPQPGPPLNGHDFDHPDCQANRLKAQALVVSFGMCPHCNGGSYLVPMSGSAWGVEHYHRSGCPSHEDFLPAEDVDLDAMTAALDEQGYGH